VTETPAQLNTSSIAAWESWLKVAGQRVHIGYERLDPDHSRHTQLSLEANAVTAQRIVSLWGKSTPPQRIIDIGCSVGFKAMALQKIWPDAEIYGIDPDDAAVDLGNTLVTDPFLLAANAAKRPRLVLGGAEAMPWPDGHFDLIICLTTIEHVSNVASTVAEISRVLSPQGVAVLEAPNYLWPMEPHLGIFVPPLSPKPLMRALARLQGRADLVWYLDHLKQVHPGMLERLFRGNHLAFTNLAEDKLRRATEGDASGVVAHRRAAQLLGQLRKLGLAKPIASLASMLRLYPSVLYLLRKENHAHQ